MKQSGDNFRVANAQKVNSKFLISIILREKKTSKKDLPIKYCTFLTLGMIFRIPLNSTELLLEKLHCSQRITAIKKEQ